MLRSLSLKATILLLVAFTCNSTSTYSQISITEIDKLVERTMKTFEVPGVAVGIVKDGKLIFAKGYGVRSLNSVEKVDENTLFGIASNSKAFTAATLAILVDEGKLKWEDKVTDYIPEFKLYDPYVTSEFTIKDLLTHRSGLGLGAGDLMIWPDSATFTKEDVIHNLRYLKPVSSFRTKFDYDNLMYLVAGEVVARVSGISWENFVELRIMKPLEMNNTAASYPRLKNKSNVVDAHAKVEGKLKVVERTIMFDNAAGGINSSINDFSKWLIMQLNHGKYGDSLSKQLFSAKAHDEMWGAQTILPVAGPGSYNTHFAAYGLGWFLSDVKGYKQVSHTGGLLGMVTQATLIPELGLGIIVLTNQQSGAAFTSITNQIKDSYLGITGTDRVKENLERVQKNEKNATETTSKIWKEINSGQHKNLRKSEINQYTGTFTDNWFGEVSINLKNNKLLFRSKRSPKLRGELFYYKGNTFVVKWVDRSLDADAFVMFDLDNNGKAVEMKMKAISPATDFSFDFQDLDFKRAKE